MTLWLIEFAVNTCSDWDQFDLELHITWGSIQEWGSIDADTVYFIIDIVKNLTSILFGK